MSEEDFEKSKGAFTPGWNDPPVFSYGAHQTQQKGYSLNKRVAYNIAGDVTQHEKCSTPEKSQVPPVGPPPLSFAPAKPEEDKAQESSPCKHVDLSTVLDNFENQLKEVYSEENEKECKEIKRRLTIMEKMWNDQKFPETVKQKLHEISEALRENKVDICDSLQRSLMVDHTSVCSSWMPAIRLLINSKRSLTQ